jgi:hypothetical protein
MPARQGSPIDGLLADLGRLRQSWPKRGWSWDTRLACVASSFVVDLTAEARAAARLALPVEFVSSTLKNAPPAVREVVEQTGGLRADQFILCSEPTLVGFAYGLWWPWGDDTTISLRIGLAGRALQSEIFRFRELFGALD